MILIDIDLANRMSADSDFKPLSDNYQRNDNENECDISISEDEFKDYKA